MSSQRQSVFKKAIPYFVFLINSGCIAYALAARFTDFLFAPRAEKLALILGCAVLAALISALLYLVFLAEIIRSPSIRIFERVLLAAFLVSGLLFLALYSPPPFPEQHQLTVTALGEHHPDATNSRVHILSVSTIAYPSRESRRVRKTDLTYNGVWRGVASNDFELFVEDGNGASITLERFMQAGIALQLRSGPDSGIVRVLWDGQESTLDLFQPQEGTITLELEPALNWAKADLTRKILVAAAMVAELTALLSALTVLFLAGTQVGLKRVVLDVRRMRLFVACAVVIIASVMVIQRVNTQADFDNPALELGIRKALDRPQGSIYQRQLLTLVELDLSGMEITSLDGIEKLTNLVSLDLRNNQIQEISLLALLEKLESLDLRENRLVDLTPISNLTRLEYLNIYGNSAIQSISPLSALTNLEKLIMADVPVRGQEDLLAGLANLEFLNMRNSGVTSTEFLSALTRLTYLNLHSNPDIRSIRTLAELRDLETLILAHVPLQDHTDQIANLNKLVHLNLRDTGVSDISFLSSLPRLQYLNLHSNPHIEAITPLASLTNLKHLILQDVPVNGQIDALAALTQLQTLNLRNTGISSIAFLSDLFAQGALQDDPKHAVSAALDIRDNPITSGENDIYASVRPFWGAITLAEPRNLPFFAALDAPSFSQSSGFYPAGFSLSITHSDQDAAIFYTLDGSEPSPRTSRYSSPIMIDLASFPPRSGAAVEDISADWEATATEIQKAVILRAKAINSTTGEESEVITKTYFIGQDVGARYTLPVISIVSDFAHFFDPLDGIYVLGSAYQAVAQKDVSEDEKQLSANFNQRGEEWERPVHVEMFDQDGQAVFSHNGGVRIHGGGSRRSAQKSLRIYADCAYDTECLFNYALFPKTAEGLDADGTPVYESFLLRNNGQDWMKGMMRDALAQSVLKETGLDMQNQAPVVVFLNGEYWGIYQLQERYDPYYFQNHYGIDPLDVTILRQEGELFRGSPQDAADYAELAAFIRSQDLSLAENYAYVAARVDIENYTDYLIANIFLANTDWPNNNIYIWRESQESSAPSTFDETDSRWRWMIFDMDFSFGLQGYGSGFEHNTLQLAQMEGWSGELLRSLLENEDYRIFFINRFADHLNTTFTSERLLEAIDLKQEELAPEMEDFFARWGSNKSGLLENWLAEVDILREFARKRETFITEQIQNQFDLGGTAVLHAKWDPLFGSLSINSIHVAGAESWDGVYFQGVPIAITALPEPGYRFSHWEGSDILQPEMMLELSGDTQITPVFVADQSE